MKNKVDTGSYTQPNYRINARLGMIVVAGQVIRNEANTSIVLGTQEGIRRFLAENQPFVGYTVYDLRDNYDITDKFTGYKTVPSRYQGGVTVVRNNG